MNNRIANLRKAIVAITNALIEKKIEVTQIGMDAYVRSNSEGIPVAVNLPYLPDNASEQLIQAIQGFLDHEVGHILFSDFKALAIRNPMLKGLTNILEDARIEKCMAQRFKGSGSNLDHTAHFFLEEMITPKFKDVMAQPDVDETKIMGILATPYLRSLSGQSTFEFYMRDKMHLLPNIHAAIKHLSPQLQAMQSSKDAVRLAKEIYEALKNPEEDKQDNQDQEDEDCEQQGNGQSDDEQEQQDGSGGGGSEGDGESDDQSGQGAGDGAEEDSEDDGESDGAGESSDDAEGKESQGKGGKGSKPQDADDDAESDDKGERHKNKSDKSNGTSDRDAGDESGDGDAQKGEEKKDLNHKLNLDADSILGEIDKESANDFDSAFAVQLSNEAKDFACNAPYLVYTDKNDVIETLSVGRSFKSSFMDELDKATKQVTGTIQKDLERLMAARSASVWENGLRRGKINQASLSRLAIKDERIFRRKQENRSKDVAVTLLIDCSGSMSGQRIHTAAQASYAMSSVLDRINIAHEVIGFTTKHGEEHNKGARSFNHNGKEVYYSRMEGLYMPIIKGFTERLTLDNRNRFAWLPHATFFNTNIDGECLQIAAQRLSQRKEARKIIMVLSDGNPNGHGSNATLNKHLKTTVADLTRSGFEVIGIGINTESVKQFYPKNVALKSVADLPHTVIGELRALLLK